MKILKTSAVVIAFGCSAAAQAATFAGNGLPASDANFVGPTQVATFTGADQTFATYSESGVTFGPGRVSSSFANGYNSFGSYFDNNAGGFNLISFSFAAPTSAFAFNWGAADEVWTVNLFSGATNIGTYSLAPTYASNAKEYFGFTGAGITGVTLNGQGTGDYVFIDNLTFGAAAVGGIPEPSAWALMILGFGLVGGALRAASRKPLAVTYA